MCAIGERFGVDPITIANDWPYDALLEIADALLDSTKSTKAERGPDKLPTGVAGIVVTKRPLVN